MIGPFTVLHDQWRGLPVDYWVAPDTVPAAWRTFGETPSMIELYSQVLGVNYPWPKYSQSIIPDFTYGGMENVSATTQTDQVLHGAAGEPEDDGRGLNAHELAHQWFGDLTTTADLVRRLAERGDHHVHGVGAEGEEPRLGRRPAVLVRTSSRRRWRPT